MRCQTLLVTYILGALLVRSASQGGDFFLPEHVKQIGTIRTSGIRESSGIAPCQKDPDVFWTHTDGPRSTLFAIDRKGRSRGQVVVNVALFDWEDLASDHKGHLYIADTGNNHLTRSQIAVHEIDEPDLTQLPSSVTVKRTWKLTFPKDPFDCESLFLWEGHGYVISKVFNNAKAVLYRFPLATTDQPLVLEKVTKLKIDSPVTAADLSRDGKKLAIICKSGAGLLQVDGDLKSAGETKPSWTKFHHEHIEACCFVPEGLLVTAESREIYLFSGDIFRTGVSRSDR